MRDDEFMAPEPFRKGKAKPVALKPWQSQVNGVVAVTAFRCWDGLMGCEKHKPKDEFHLHPLICDACAGALADRFGVSRSDVEVLALLMHMDAGLFRMAKYLKANPDKVSGMERSREHYLGELFRSVKKGIPNGEKVKTTIKAFRDWFHDQVEIENPKPKHAQGMVSLSAALPVGDR